MPTASVASQPRPNPNSDEGDGPTPPAHGKNRKDAKNIPDLYSDANKLDTQFTTATENGLFEHQNVVTHEQIMSPLKKAIAISLTPDISADQYAEGLADLDTAQHLLAKAIGAVSLSKRLSYFYGIPVLGYLTLVFLADLWLARVFVPRYPGGLPFLSIPANVLIAGSVGAILRGMTSLWLDVDRLQYRKIWATFYLESPIIGALLGGLVYLAFYVGIVVTTSGAAVTNPILLILVAALAGYNWAWSRDVLKKVVELFSVEQPKGAKGTS